MQYFLRFYVCASSDINNIKVNIMKKLELVATCVSTTPDELEFLEEMMDKEREIELSTFKKYVEIQPVRDAFGYVTGKKQGVKIEKDWHVRFFKSIWKGEACVFMRHSAIEYIFQ